MTDTSSEVWRATCEARWLASKPVPEIESFLELVAKKRGKDAAERLRHDAREEWKKQNKK